MSLHAPDQPVTIVACALQADWPLAQHPGLMALRRAQRIERQTLAAASPCAPHEWAYAQAMSWDCPPARLPFAAANAAQLGLSCPPEHGWAFIDAVHWDVSQGQVHLRSVGVVTPAEDQAMTQAMQPYFEEDGIHLHPLGDGRWLAHAAHFKHLPSVSLSRVWDHDVAYWLEPDSVAAQNPSQRLLRRLQNEMQMLLYTHALNDKRAIPINSFWWSGTGDLPLPNTPRQVLVNTDLQSAFNAQDPQAWSAQWLHLAQTLMVPALQSGHRLVLCGEDRFISLQAPPPGLWQSLKDLWPRPALKALLS